MENELNKEQTITNESRLNNPLKSTEITVGISEINPSSGTFEMYLKVDPRIVMDKLDEKFGPLGWKKETSLKEIGGKKVMHCTLSVKCEGEWISRDDHSGGAAWAENQESKVMEADALRRAAVQFGIGRELYTFKNIVATLKDDSGNDVLNIFSIKDDFTSEEKYYSKDELYVEQIVYDEHYHIVAVSIKNLTKNNVRVYSSDRRSMSVQGTIVNGESDVLSIDEATKVLADVGNLKNKPLGELTVEQLVHVWEKSKSQDVKQAALRIAQTMKEARELLSRMGVKI